MCWSCVERVVSDVPRTRLSKASYRPCQGVTEFYYRRQGALGFQNVDIWGLLLFIRQSMCSCSVTQLCLTLCEPVDCSPPGSSVHGIFQTRILGWITISSSKDPPHPGIKPTSLASPAQASRFFTTEPSGKPSSDRI